MFTGWHQLDNGDWQRVTVADTRSACWRQLRQLPCAGHRVVCRQGVGPVETWEQQEFARRRQGVPPDRELVDGAWVRLPVVKTVTTTAVLSEDERRESYWAQLWRFIGFGQNK